MRRHSILLLLIWSGICAGCTHTQLKISTTNQLRTQSDIIQQQILDNVAKILVNQNAWPDYAILSDATAQVTDGGSGGGSLTWNPTTLVSESLNLGASRNVTERWGMTAITNPARIRAMWSAYHYSIYGYTPTIQLWDGCYYDGAAHLNGVFRGDFRCHVPSPGWLACGDKAPPGDVHDCNCIVGKYCGTYAWATPEGQAALQQLTYAIMHIATVYYENNVFPTGMVMPEAFRERPMPQPSYREFFFPTPGPLVTPQAIQ